MVTRIMALMASLASRCGLSGSTATARAGKPARERLTFGVVQVDSYLHRHGYLLVSQTRARTRAARAGSAWSSSKQGPEGLGAADPRHRSLLCVLSHLGQKT